MSDRIFRYMQEMADKRALLRDEKIKGYMDEVNNSINACYQQLYRRLSHWEERPDDRDNLIEAARLGALHYNDLVEDFVDANVRSKMIASFITELRQIAEDRTYTKLDWHKVGADQHMVTDRYWPHFPIFKVETRALPKPAQSDEE